MASTGGPEQGGEPDPKGDAPSTPAEESAWAALRAAGARVGLDVIGALMRPSGVPTVFRLVGPVEARVSIGGHGAATARRAMAVARWLESAGFPAVRLVPGVEQPVVVEGGAVTFWRLVAEEERRADLGQVGELLRRLHWLEEPASLGLAELDPLRDAWQAIEANSVLSEDDRAFLSSRAAELVARFAELDFVLPRGMVHGNASHRSALLDTTGQAVLTELEGFSTGPREWDLALTALSFERLGWHTRSEHEAFVQGYGFDVMGWYGYATLADLGELLLTLDLSRRTPADPATMAEVQRRIHDLRTHGDRRGWQSL